MFAIEYHDFDTDIDTKPLQAKFKVIRKRAPESVIWVCPKKEDLVSFVYELEYDLSNKYPDESISRKSAKRSSRSQCLNS